MAGSGQTGANVKNTLILMLCVAAGVLAGGSSGQELYNSDSGTRVSRAQDDADVARRHETDLANQVAEQERSNASIREQLRKVDNDPAGLLKDLVDVSDQAAVLRKKVADQRVRRDAAEDHYDNARAKAMDAYEETGPVIAARHSVTDAAAELDRLSQPILEQLGQDEGYQEAQALVDAAEQAGESLQGFDNVDPQAQAEADSAFDQALANVQGLEDAAIDADPKAAEARKSLKIAQDMLDGLRMENEKKIATNPAVDAARFSLDLEQKLLDDSSAELSTAEKRLSALRQTTQPNAGPPTELANQLKEGEARLRDLNDQLDQAKVARDDAEQRLRFAQAGGQPSTGAPLPPPDYGQPGYEPYSDSDYYDDSSYYSYGGYPDYGYGYSYRSYPYYGYRSYPYYSGYPYHSYVYDPFCPPYYSYGFIGTGFFFGFDRDFRHHDYDRGHYAYYHHDRNDAWRSRYDYYRRHDDFHGDRDHDGRAFASRDGRTGFGSSRYDNARFNRSEVSRDRAARANIDRARLGTASAERDYRYRTGVNTYSYPGSTKWRARDQESASLRAQQFELQAQERRSAAESDARRAGISIEPSRSSRSTAARSGTSVRGDDSAARRARAEEAASADSTRARSEWRPRTSADETRGTRPNEDFGRSRSSDAGSSRSRSSDVGSSRSRSSDVGSSRSRSSDAGSSRTRSSDVSRSRGSEAPPARSAAPSRGRSEAPAPSPSPSRSRSSSFRGSDSTPSAGSGRSSRGSFSPPPDLGSSRGSSRGRDASPPPSRSAPTPSRGDSGGSFRGGSRASSPAPSRSGGGSSSSSGGGRRGR
jgi:hypothetical protein